MGRVSTTGRRWLVPAEPWDGGHDREGRDAGLISLFLALCSFTAGTAEEKGGGANAVRRLRGMWKLVQNENDGGRRR